MTLMKIDGSCQDCSGKGWVGTYGYDSIHDCNNGWHIEKCDLCGVFKTDTEAKKHANSSDPYSNPPIS